MILIRCREMDLRMFIFLDMQLGMYVMIYVQLCGSFILLGISTSLLDYQREWPLFCGTSGSIALGITTPLVGIASDKY